jgi:hypothetical protein
MEILCQFCLRTEVFILHHILYYGYNGTPLVLTALHQSIFIKFLSADSESNLLGSV